MHCAWCALFCACTYDKSFCINIDPLDDVSGDFQSPLGFEAFVIVSFFHIGSSSCNFFLLLFSHLNRLSIYFLSKKNTTSQRKQLLFVVHLHTFFHTKSVFGFVYYFIFLNIPCQAPKHRVIDTRTNLLFTQTMHSTKLQRNMKHYALGGVYVVRWGGFFNQWQYIYGIKQKKKTNNFKDHWRSLEQKFVENFCNIVIQKGHAIKTHLTVRILDRWYITLSKRSFYEPQNQRTFPNSTCHSLSDHGQ